MNQQVLNELLEQYAREHINEVQRSLLAFKDDNYSWTEQIEDALASLDFLNRNNDLIDSDGHSSITKSAYRDIFEALCNLAYYDGFLLTEILGM